MIWSPSGLSFPIYLSPVLICADWYRWERNPYRLFEITEPIVFWATSSEKSKLCVINQGPTWRMDLPGESLEKVDSLKSMISKTTIISIQRGLSSMGQNHNKIYNVFSTIVIQGSLISWVQKQTRIKFHKFQQTHFCVHTSKMYLR